MERDAEGSPICAQVLGAITKGNMTGVKIGSGVGGGGALVQRKGLLSDFKDIISSPMYDGRFVTITGACLELPCAGASEARWPEPCARYPGPKAVGKTTLIELACSEVGKACV